MAPSSFPRALRACLTTFIWLLSSAAPAQIPVLPPVAVTAARMAQPVSDLLADVTVIDADSIARAGEGGLAALLQRQPGVEIVTNGGPASTSGVFLRGSNTAHALVLVDGMRVGSSTAGTSPLEAIPLDQIERVEILRGPASSLYGADALGGVIQVFTRNAAESFAANARAAYGTYGTAIVSGGVSGTSGAWRYALQSGYRRSDGFNTIGNAANFGFDPDRDGYRGEDAGGSVGFRIAPEQEISARFFRSRVNAQFDAGDSFDDRTITTLESYQLESRNRLASYWTSRLQLGWSSDDSDSRTGFGPSRFRTRQRMFAWQSDFELPRGTLIAALERREERVDGDAAFAVTARNTNAIVGVYQLREGAHLAQASVRNDDSSQFGSRTTGGVAYGYAFAPSLRASVNYATAFKAPTFNDLYYPGFSNPELSPETAGNAELALRYAKDELTAGVVAYRNRVRDLIVFECDASFNCAPQNVTDATLKGMTIELGARAGEFRASASIDFQTPRDESTGRLLPRRARRHAAATLVRDAGPWRAGVELVAASARFDDAANARRMGGYTLLNVFLERVLAPQWTFFSRVDNALDKRYELAADYNTARAAVLAGVRYQY